MKETKEKNKKDEYVLVPVSWLETLLDYAEKGDEDKSHLRGYCSSAKTILKFCKRVEQ